MWTRGRLSRNWAPDTLTGGLAGQSTVPHGQWYRGVMLTGGVQPLRLPPGSSGFGFAMDPSDPSTWRRPVRWT